jgi:hypothetical protein
MSVAPVSDILNTVKVLFNVAISAMLQCYRKSEVISCVPRVSQT